MHTNTRTHTTTDEANDRERGDNRSAMISLPRSRPDKPSTSLPSRSHSHPASISARGTDRQVAIYQVESRRLESEREGHSRPSVREYASHWANEALMGASATAEQTTPCISPLVPSVALIISEKGLSLVQRPSVRPTILGRSNPVRIVVFNYNHKVS